MCIGVGQGIAMIRSVFEHINLRVPYNDNQYKADPIETASVDELQALQTQRLNGRSNTRMKMSRCIGANSTQRRTS